MLFSPSRSFSTRVCWPLTSGTKTSAATVIHSVSVLPILRLPAPGPSAFFISPLRQWALPHGRAVATSLLEWPTPFHNFRLIRSVFMRIVPGVNLLIAEPFFGMRSNRLEFRHPVDNVNRQGEAIYFVVDGQFHRLVD